MKFKPENVFYALNATEDLIGAKGYFANSISDLRYFVVENCGKIDKVISLDDDFVVQNDENYNFFYLVEPSEKYWVKDSNGKLSIIDKNCWEATPDNLIKFKGSLDECRQYIKEHTKPDVWYVTENANKFVIVEKERIIKWYFDVNDERVLFYGTKEDCETWISEHSVTLADIGLETEPKFRPFKDCDELIETYKEEWCSDLGEYDLPTIWVRPKGGNTGGDMITDFNATSVRVLGNWWSLKDLFKTYTFLDGSSCGVKE